MKLRVGTRRSPLALTQTRQAMDELVRRRGIDYELVEIVTTGDRILDRPLREAGGKGLFLKELDEALLAGHVDCAVHSLKDVPTDLAPGTMLCAVLERADVRDVLITARGLELEQLAQHARIGTTSLRRQAQALAALPGASIAMLRGNVETRLRRVAAGEFDATFLAAAGLGRLGLTLAHGMGRDLPVRGVALDPFEFVPAPGQGALAITARAGDSATAEVLMSLDHGPSRLAVLAERGFARVFGGGCHLPVAAYADRHGDELRLVGLLLSPDGGRSLREQVRAQVGDGQDAAADEIGATLGRAFLARGAREIIELAAGAQDSA